MINHPPNHHFYRWYGYHSQSWVAYDIVLPTLQQMICYIQLNPTWWYTYPAEKYKFVSWDDSSQYMESHNPVMFPTTNQCIDLLSPY